MRHSPKSLVPERPRLPFLGALSAAFATAALLLSTTGCEDRSTSETAKAVFGHYQDALFAGDRNALRRLLSLESRGIIEHLPLDRVKGKQRLEVVDAVVKRPEVLLTVRDPNEGNRESHYVMVKERGELVLDLIATTAYHSYERATPDGVPSFTPQKLRQDEIAKIQARYGTAFR